MPTDWNTLGGRYGRIYGAIYNNKYHSIVAANNGITMRDMNAMAKFQPALPNFPKSPNPLSSEKVIVLPNNANQGDWYKTRETCSASAGSSTSHLMKILLIPSIKYWEYTSNWNARTFTGRSQMGFTTKYCNKADNQCIEQMKANAQNLSKFFNQPDVIPAILKVIVTAPAVKADLEF